jgi:predicted nucleic acid-binding protein
MAQYLLGPNTLIDACYAQTPSNAWLKTVKTADLFTSVIAVSYARETISANAPDPQALNRIRTIFQQVLARLINGGLSILPFERQEAAEWELWRSHLSLHSEINGTPFHIGQDNRMIIATAAANGLHLVEPAELYHAELRAAGLLVTSL